MDGLPTSQEVRLMNRKRWNLSPRVRQDAVDFLERVINDEECGTKTRINAVECLLKMDLVDIAAEKDESTAAAAAATAAPTMVLLLPPNGTEVSQ